MNEKDYKAFKSWWESEGKHFDGSWEPEELECQWGWKAALDYTRRKQSPYAWHFEFNNGKSVTTKNKKEADSIKRNLKQDETCTELFTVPPARVQHDGAVFENDAAWELAQKVRIDLDRRCFPGPYMDVVMESINRHYQRPPAPIDLTEEEAQPMRLSEGEAIDRFATAMQENIKLIVDCAKRITEKAEQTCRYCYQNFGIEKSPDGFLESIAEMALSIQIQAKSLEQKAQPAVVRQLIEVLDDCRVALEMLGYPVKESVYAAMQSSKESGL